MLSQETSFLVFSDLHAHTHKKYSQPLSKGLNTRFQVSIEVLEQLIVLSEKLKIKDVIFSGDLFDAKNHVPIVVFNEIFNIFKKIDRLDINVLMIPGNHDLAVRTGEANDLMLFNQFKNIHVIDEPTVNFPWKLKQNRLVNVTAIPYRDSLKNISFKVASKNDSNLLNICVAHGIPISSKLREEDLRTADQILYSKIGKIDLSLLESFHLSVVGHIHYPQILGDRCQILLPGQPWHQWPHEASQQSGIWEVKVTAQQVTYLLHELETPNFINLIVYPDFTVHLNNEEDVEVLLTDKCLKNNIILVQGFDQTVSLEVLYNVKDQLYKNNEVFFVGFLPPIHDSKIESCQTRLQIKPQSSPQDVFLEVLNSKHVYLGGLDSKDLADVGLEILQEALSEVMK